MSDELRDVKRIGPPVLPVSIIDCFVCHGTGWVETRVRDDAIGEGHECRYCNGRGRIATDNGEV